MATQVRWHIAVAQRPELEAQWPCCNACLRSMLERDRKEAGRKTLAGRQRAREAEGVAPSLKGGCRHASFVPVDQWQRLDQPLIEQIAEGSNAVGALDLVADLPGAAPEAQGAVDQSDHDDKQRQRNQQLDQGKASVRP